MSNTAHSENGKKWKIVGWSALGILVFLQVIWGIPLKWLPDRPTAESKGMASASRALDSHFKREERQQGVDKEIHKGDVDKGIADLSLDRLQDRGYRQKLADPLLGLRRNCPDNREHDRVTGHVEYDFTACVDNEIHVGLPNPWKNKLIRYNAHLGAGSLKEEERSKIGFLKEEPVFKADASDEFSVATKNDDGTWTLRGGEITLVKHGGNILMLDPVKEEN